MEKSKLNEEDLIRKWLADAGTEEPSTQFNAQVMKKLQVQSSEAFTYKPIISKQVLFIIYMSIASLLTFLIFNGTSSGITIPYYKIRFLQNYLNSIDVRFNSPLLLMIIVTAWMLFLLDRAINKKVGSAN